MTSPRSLTLIAVAGGLLAAAIGVGWWRGADRATPQERPPAGTAGRRAALTDLRDRLLPSTEGGWVAESPGEPVLTSWLIAGAHVPDPAAFDRALAEAGPELDRAGGDRALALVLAQVLPGPGRDRERADRLAAEVFRRTQDRLDAGDASWLGPLLQLSAGSSPSAEAAGDELVARAGSVGCERLPAAGAPLPAPSGSLTVVLRVLAVRAEHCAGAAGVLADALADPAWDTWIATTELTDLAAIADPLPAGTRTALARRFDRFLEVGPDEPIDLGAVAAVQPARQRLGMADAVSGALEHHLQGQVAHRGGLAGRSTSVPTPFDVAILRQLVAEGLASDRQLAVTREARRWPDEPDAVDPAVDELLAGTSPLACSDAPGAADPDVRVTLPGLVADELGTVVRASCRDDLDLSAHVRHLQASGRADQRPLRIATAVLAACRLDPRLVDDLDGVRLAPEGPFATDSVLVWARAVAADPVAACAAADG